ncbi:MAG: guanylate kinase [Elusimicrobia bacterium]|nr:guanylate kinase [Elusimicrobiota bacterium]
MNKLRYFPVVISAPSGGGKSAVKNYLLKTDKRFAFSVTCTTRAPRPGEKEGRDYYFVSESKFRSLIRKRALIEWAQVHGRLYGTPKKSVLSLLKKGKIPLMTIDVKGAESVKKIFKDSVSIFLLPPSLKIMKKRLEKRGENSEEISLRMKTAKKELKEAFSYDYLVINEDLKKAAEDICAVVEAEKLKLFRNSGFVKKFASDFYGKN